MEKEGEGINRGLKESKSLMNVEIEGSKLIPRDKVINLSAEVTIGTKSLDSAKSRNSDIHSSGEALTTRSFKFHQRFADAVATASYLKYNELPKTGKPQEGKEWTLLSTVIQANESVCDMEGYPTLTVVALGTGSKCIGRKKMSQSGDVLNDSHAEVLARRAFLRYLYHQIELTRMGTASTIFCLSPKDGRCALKPFISFHLYCSHTPCGDASIFPKTESICEQDEIGPCLQSRYDEVAPHFQAEDNMEEEQCTTAKTSLSGGHEDRIGGESVKDDPPCKKQKLLEIDIHRTGAKCLPDEKRQDSKLPGIEFHVVGAVRTKPGRGDPTLSVSCSDKLARWNCVGIQGALLSRLITSPIYLQSLTIGGDCPVSFSALRRAVVDRVAFCCSDIQDGYQCNTPSFLQSRTPFPGRRNATNNHKPAPASIIWCLVPNRCHEVAVEGRKQGVTKKAQSTSAGRLHICKRELLRQFIACCSIKVPTAAHADSRDIFSLSESKLKGMKYIDLKSGAVNYKTTWSSVQNMAGLPWTIKPTHLLNFTL